MTTFTKGQSFIFTTDIPQKGIQSISVDGNEIDRSYYIINQTKTIEDIENQIKDLEFKINNKQELDKIIISDLEEISKKYGKDRQTNIITKVEELSSEELIESYPTKIIYTQNYIKKYSREGQQNIREGETVIDNFNCDNKDSLFVITK